MGRLGAMKSFRSSRERHGRTPRGSLVSHLGARTSMSFFETVVSQTVDFLRNAWPDELSKLDYRILDAPVTNRPDGEVPRYSANPQTLRITVYRLPIERLSHHRRTDRLDERFHIEQVVFQGAAELIGKNPDDLIPDQFKR